MKKKTIQSKEAKEKIDAVLEGAIKAGNDLKSILQKAREKFESADEDTKKKIVAGIASAVVILTAIVGAKRIAKKHRCKKEGK